MELLTALIGFTIKYIFMIAAAVIGVSFGKFLRIQKNNQYK